MNIKTTVALAILSLTTVACSGGGDGGNDSTGTAVVPDITPLEVDLPTDAELATTQGQVTVDQAIDLIVGEWVNVDDATQCVTTFQFGQFGLFSEAGLDHRASGEYDIEPGEDFFDEDLLATEINKSFLSENFMSDCFGQINDSDALNTDPVRFGFVTFSDFVSFPERDVMIISSRVLDANGNNPSGFPGAIVRFTRQ